MERNDSESSVYMLRFLKETMDALTIVIEPPALCCYTNNSRGLFFLIFFRTTGGL